MYQPKDCFKKKKKEVHHLLTHFVPKLYVLLSFMKHKMRNISFSVLCLTFYLSSVEVFVPINNKKRLY